MSSYLWQGWAPDGADVYDDTSDESLDSLNWEYEPYPMAKSAQGAGGAIDDPDPPPRPPPAPRPTFAQPIPNPVRVPLPPVPESSRNTTNVTNTTGVTQDPKTVWSGPPPKPDGPAGADGSADSFDVSDFLSSEDDDIRFIPADPKDQALLAAENAAWAAEKAARAANDNSGVLDPMDIDVIQAEIDAQTASVHQSGTAATNSSPDRAAVDEADRMEIDSPPEETTTVYEPLDTDDRFRQIAVVFPPRAFRTAEAGQDWTKWASTQWLQRNKAGFIYMHNLKPQAPAGRALLVCSRAGGYLVVNKNIHKDVVREDGWNWNADYRRWWHPAQHKRYPGEIFGTTAYHGAVPPEIRFARLDDPLVTYRLPDEPVFPELHAIGISNGPEGVERDADRNVVRVDEYSLYFKHFNGHNLRSILAYTTQGPKTHHLYLEEYFIWYVMEQLVSAVIYMQSGITRTELKNGVTEKKEGWKPFVHRNIIPEHIYLHFEEAWERGQEEYDRTEVDKAKRDTNEMYERARQRFPRIVLGSWSQANAMDDGWEAWIYNRGQRTLLADVNKLREEEPRVKWKGKGIKPELWEDIYLVGAVLRRLVSVWDARDNEEAWKTTWIDYNVDAKGYTMADARQEREGKPTYSSELYDMLEKFELHDEAIQEEDGTYWGEERYWDGSRAFPDVDNLINYVFPIAYTNAQAEKRTLWPKEDTGEITKPNFNLIETWCGLTRFIDMMPYTPESKGMDEDGAKKVVMRDLQLIHGTKYIIWYQFQEPAIEDLIEELPEYLGVPWARQAMQHPAKLWGKYWYAIYQRRTGDMQTPPGGRSRRGDEHWDTEFAGRRILSRERYEQRGAFEDDGRVKVFHKDLYTIESDDDRDEGHRARKSVREKEWKELIESYGNLEDPFLYLTEKQHLKRVLRWMRRAKRVLWHLYPVALPDDETLQLRNDEEQIASQYLKIMRNEVALQAAGQQVTDTPEERAIKQKYHVMLERLDPKGEYKVGYKHEFAKPPAPREPTPQPREPTPAPRDPTPAPRDPTPAPRDPTPAPRDPTPAPREPTPAPREPTPPLPPSPFTQYRKDEEARKIQAEITRAEHQVLRDRVKAVADRIVVAAEEMNRLETDDTTTNQYARYLEAKRRHEELLVKGRAYEAAINNLPKLETYPEQKQRLENEIVRNQERIADLRRELQEPKKMRKQKATVIAELDGEARRLRAQAGLPSSTELDKAQLEGRAAKIEAEAADFLQQVTEIKEKQDQVMSKIWILEHKIESYRKTIRRIDRELVRQEKPAKVKSAFCRGYEQAMRGDLADSERPGGAPPDDDGGGDDDGNDGGGGGGGADDTPEKKTNKGKKKDGNNDNGGGGSSSKNSGKTTANPTTAPPKPPPPGRRTTRSGRVVRPVSVYSPTKYNITRTRPKPPTGKKPPTGRTGRDIIIPQTPEDPDPTPTGSTRSSPDSAAGSPGSLHSTTVIPETPYKLPGVGDETVIPQSQSQPNNNDDVIIPLTQPDDDEVIPQTQPDNPQPQPNQDNEEEEIIPQTQPNQDAGDEEVTTPSSTQTKKTKKPKPKPLTGLASSPMPKPKTSRKRAAEDDDDGELERLSPPKKRTPGRPKKNQ
ncbi:hypothetical protein QBC41DRAFT_222763 [Cercophora samala]|uniref:Uncharacterized protein n=1 Tax=Cercophora samala TaxID=330535 RepID=A0AA39ZFA8_9PEZI|nr:hypothetical protein QBC41DRAFT_222763 [Cercophora samala]